MQIRKSGLVALLLALSASVAAGLSTGSVWTVIERFVVTLVFGGLGLFMAESSGIKGALSLKTKSAGAALRDIVLFGVGPGIALGLVNDRFFFGYRYSPFVLPRIRNIDSIGDAFLLSLEIGLAEEVIYRLFFLSCILYTAKYALQRSQASSHSAIPASIAVVVSTLIFAFAHRSPLSLTAVFLAGIVLGLIYLFKGVEASIAAHFVANFIFFSASYVN